jgi:hypothetical protein
VVLTLARALLPPYAVDTRRVDHLALPLGCGFGLSVPGTRLIRSGPSPVPRCIFLPRASKRAAVKGWLWGQGEVAMCVLLSHSMVRTRDAVGRRCTHRMSAPRAIVWSAPQRLLVSAGVGMGCLGLRCVFCGSEPPSQFEGVVIQLAGLRLVG